ncbi:DUF11 domain-containing protein [Microbacterium sp. p3-SID336]|uniref:DUF11 domain-containing protein n=1 Tax=Microbacterium sp. p3-SID336 TaxID=2916212 RepID=UPI0021A3446D|nr:DUF11 domain-containing protein [Microbacterium sp. p3-SID336]MCT1478413.1 DUF11 domain-containing protein [Microbacterium sp. p3-SID336]
MLIAAGLALLLGAAGLGGVSAAVAAPGSPGVPQAPAAAVYLETFENQTATSGIRIGQYTGGAAANTETYLTSPNWAPAADQCNGWILRSSTPRNATVTGVDSGCDATAWAYLQGMATAIGLYIGEPLTTAQQNQILSEYTNGGSAPGPGVEFQTAKPITAGIVPGHFYLISAVYGAANCVSEGPTLNRVDPQLSFNLLVNQTGSGPAPGTGGGTVTTLASGLNPCTDPAAREITVGGRLFHVAELQSAGFRADATTTSLGVQLFNAAGGFRGNDSGFDDPQIVDATPQLDKVFSPTTVKVGQTSTLTFTITNTDELEAKNGWSFTDTLPAGLRFAGEPVTDCPAGVATVDGTSISGTGNMDAGTVSCTFTVPITSDTEGAYTNGPANIGPISGLLEPGESTVVFTAADAPAISVVKSANLTDPAQYVLGAPVTYSFLVTNTGNVDLTAVAVAETAFSGAGTPPVASCPQTTLAPGEETTCTAGYTLTQADIDAGEVTNTAQATGTPPEGDPVTASDDAVISGSEAPQLSLVKTADASGVQSPTRVGDPIAYTILVSNTGNVTLTGVAVTDTLLGSAITAVWPGVPGTLAPGEDVTVTGTHSVTQLDIETGAVTNTATATARDPNGDDVPAGPQSTTTPLNQAPALSLLKSATPVLSTPPAPGDPITFSFTITNTGNLQLSDVAITDRLPGLSSIAYTWPSDPGVLPPGADATATATYAITQADIDAGVVANTAVANGTTEGGADVPSNEADTSTPLAQAPALTLVKAADAAGITDPAQPGQPIVYSFTVTNAGNTTLTAVAIIDQLAGLPPLTYTWPAADGVLLPGQEATAASTYLTTAADIDDGEVTNNATATGQPPTGAPVDSGPATTTTPLVQAPSLTLVKTADASGITDPAEVGQPVVYSFTVTNTGNTTLTDVVVTDELAGLPPLAYTWPGAAGVLRAGEEATATSTYAITAADITRGTVTNTATATGRPPTGDPVGSDPATTTTVLVAAPEPPPSPPPGPSQGGLSNTGGTVPLIALTVAAILLIAGSALAAYTRRRKVGGDPHA